MAHLIRVLYLTNERANRVVDFYRPLERELAKLVELAVYRRPLDGQIEGTWCYNCTKGGHRPAPVLDPKGVREYDWIITDAMYSYLTEDWPSLRVRKAVLWADQHGPMVQTYLPAAFAAGFDLFLPLYRDSTPVFHPYLNPAKVHWLSYWIDPEVFLDWQMPRSVGVLSTGVLHEIVYPVRTQAAKALEDQPWFLRVERPADTVAGTGYWPVGADYARLINGSRIAISCTSRFNYPITKTYEIPAARCALASDWVPEMRQLGLEPGVNMLELPRGDYLSWFAGWLDRPEELEAITEAGYRLMHSRHTAAVKAQELADTLLGVLAREGSFRC